MEGVYKWIHSVTYSWSVAYIFNGMAKYDEEYKNKFDIVEVRISALRFHKWFYLGTKVDINLRIPKQVQISGVFHIKSGCYTKQIILEKFFNMVLMWRHIKELMEEVALGLLLFTAYWIVWLIRKIWNWKDTFGCLFLSLTCCIRFLSDVSLYCSFVSS